MIIKIVEEYENEARERGDEIMKALFPNTRAMSTLKVPERDFREPVFRQLLDDLEKKYKMQLEGMWDIIESKLAEWYGK